MQPRLIASVFVAALMTVGGTTFVGCGSTDDDGGSTPAPAEKTQTKERQTEGGEEPQGGREDPQRGERKDLLSFKLSDRSEAGITNIWVTWTIKNHSSEKSNYSWDWEAVNPSGTRDRVGRRNICRCPDRQWAGGQFASRSLILAAGA